MNTLNTIWIYCTGTVDLLLLTKKHPSIAHSHTARKTSKQKHSSAHCLLYSNGYSIYRSGSLPATNCWRRNRVMQTTYRPLLLLSTGTTRTHTVINLIWMMIWWYASDRMRAFEMSISLALLGDTVRVPYLLTTTSTVWYSITIHASQRRFSTLHETENDKERSFMCLHWPFSVENGNNISYTMWIIPERSPKYKLVSSYPEIQQQHQQQEPHRDELYRPRMGIFWN